MSLIVTNEVLDYAALLRLAVQVHTSMARAIQPFSTQADGDTLFAASTEELYGDTELNPPSGFGLSPVLGAVAAETMWDAILASVPKEQTFVPSANVTVPAAVLASYAGQYEFGPKLRLSVKVADKKLRVESIGDHPIVQFGTPVAVIPISEAEFYVDNRYHFRIAFSKDSAGHVAGAVLNPGRWEQKGKKLLDPKEHQD